MISPPDQPFNGCMPEDAANADWLKTPSEMALSAGIPNTPKAVMKYLREQGLQDSPLYRRLKADPNFEAKLRDRFISKPRDFRICDGAAGMPPPKSGAPDEPQGTAAGDLGNGGGGDAAG